MRRDRTAGPGSGRGADGSGSPGNGQAGDARRDDGRRGVTGRLLVAVAIVVAIAVGVGGGFGIRHARGELAGTVPELGVSAAISAGRSASARGYSEPELQALAQPLPSAARSVHVPVLMYHYVDEEPPPAGKYADGLTVRTPEFIDEMDYLAKNGYHTVTLVDAYLAMAGLRGLPEKPVALTFDDGGIDNYTVAFPILEERGMKATFFVITKTVGAQGQMSWDDLREMAAKGMSIQSHSYSHPGLPGVSDERLRSELVDSRDAIGQALDQPVCVLSYPSGEYDDRVVRAAKAAGYVMAVTTDKGGPLSREDIFEITRTRIQPFLPLGTFARLVR
jgi:peptidoglycan/xylan/chitin deacetylase (PgdA/CDA1 family)